MPTVILGCPLLLIVTRLRCGGFILALRLNHAMCDDSAMPIHEYIGEMAQEAWSQNDRNIFVSDVTSSEFGEIDLGCGWPEYGGPAMAVPLISFYVKYNNRGEDGVVVPILLPLQAMKRFQQELKKLIERTNNKHETMERVKITSML
ncbi:hypothetical protein FNV43_RR10339 [Rhamnella rubrinervis]|uniref:Uncharacterized protein n=1 Tax=Rhamnella rubrinervis TaxID=2594499 RepID=A0A8K0HD22_9ROSA|nr:hypothetical protein FNV43_RR10339 [Rhamnella rubrinervis]